jgi:UDP-MurNAc hydroxylase
VPIARLTARAREHLWDVQRKDSYFPASRLYLDVTDRKRRFEIDLSKEGVVESKLDDGGTLREPYLRISMPSTLLAMMLINHVSWNMADGARLLDYDRVPNVYDPKLYAYLNHLIV